MRIGLKHGKKKINLDIKVCNGFEKFSGLMFNKKESAKALLFNFKKPTKIKIHSLFVFFPFIAIWLDHKNEVVDLKIVKSFNFSVSQSKPFCKLVEIPINKKYKKIVELFLKK
ncbi:DUF192 domain-containing protein [Candidatus Pacearchaeota archaeon]|nr:DUF192 domain-containing protein [Candidatus Pacearchaeota archaeon]